MGFIVGVFEQIVDGAIAPDTFHHFLSDADATIGIRRLAVLDYCHKFIAGSFATFEQSYSCDDDVFAVLLTLVHTKVAQLIF